jgi:hypothetical protein
VSRAGHSLAKSEKSKGKEKELRMGFIKVRNRSLKINGLPQKFLMGFRGNSCSKEAERT